MPIPDEIDTIIILPDPIQRITDLIASVKLQVRIDQTYHKVYLALMSARQDNYTGEFLEEFSHANSAEEQAVVLDKWVLLV